MSTTLYVRVFGISGVAAEHMRRFPKGKLSVTAELCNTKSSTAQCHFGNDSVKLDQVAWNAKDGLLKWEINPDELQQMKAVQPKLKLHIMVHAATGNDSAEAGYVLVDIRDLSRGEIKQQVYKTNRMPGGELTLSCKATAAAHATRHPTKVIDDATPASAPATSVASSLNQSTDSVRSVLRLALNQCSG